MSEDRGQRIRMSERLRRQLSEVSSEDWVIENPDYRTDRRGYNAVLATVLPEDTESEEVTMVDAHSIDPRLIDRIEALAGKHVPRHAVVDYYVTKALAAHHPKYIDTRLLGIANDDD